MVSFLRLQKTQFSLFYKWMDSIGLLSFQQIGLDIGSICFYNWRTINKQQTEVVFIKVTTLQIFLFLYYICIVVYYICCMCQHIMYVYINYILYTYLLLSCYYYVIVCFITLLYHSSYVHITYLLISLYISISIYYNIFEMYYLLTKCFYTLCELVL